MDRYSVVGDVGCCRVDGRNSRSDGSETTERRLMQLRDQCKHGRYAAHLKCPGGVLVTPEPIPWCKPHNQPMMSGFSNKVCLEWVATEDGDIGDDPLRCVAEDRPRHFTIEETP